jgi:acetylornithine deacetylase/succinyl-diaminopimelate desuccinylase-like protein
MKGPVMVMTVGLIAGGAAKAADAPVQAKNSFAFEVHAPLREVAPLFGPEGERCWAGKHWNPVFVWPQPAKDVQGAVFTVQHGEHTSVWVNAVFDLAAGRMQYVAMIPDAMTFTVDVRLTAEGVSATKVEVTYTRTALDAGLNEEIEAMGKRDRESGPYWKRDIESALARGVVGKCVAEK